MGEIIPFPKKCKKIEQGYYIVTPDGLNYIMSTAEDLLAICDRYKAELDFIKKMSISDRLFNWPY